MMMIDNKLILIGVKQILQWLQCSAGIEVATELNALMPGEWKKILKRPKHETTIEKKVSK